jgi:hypothetical protein
MYIRLTPSRLPPWHCWPAPPARRPRTPSSSTAAPTAAAALRRPTTSRPTRARAQPPRAAARAGASASRSTARGRSPPTAWSSSRTSRLGSTYTGYDDQEPGHLQVGRRHAGCQRLEPGACRADRLAHRPAVGLCRRHLRPGQGAQTTSTSKQNASTALQWAMLERGVRHRQLGRRRAAPARRTTSGSRRRAPTRRSSRWPTAMLTASSTYGQKYNISILTKAGNAGRDLHHRHGQRPCPSPARRRCGWRAGCGGLRLAAPSAEPGVRGGRRTLPP